MLLYRWLNLFWIVGVFSWELYAHNLASSSDSNAPVAHPAAGYTLLALALFVTAGLTELYQRDPDLLLRPSAVLFEVAVASALLFADDWVYGFAEHAQSLPSMWVIAAVIAIAIAGGQRAATITGVGIGLCRYAGWLLFADRDGDVGSVSRLATIVLLGVLGWVAGYVLNKLAEAERSISAYRAREEVARTLHDGVLQTLSVIQRRSEDRELVEIARSQELELREYLYDVNVSTHSDGPRIDPSGAATTETDLASGLRATARRAEQRYQIRVNVVTAPDLEHPEPAPIAAVCGAVSEALTNAAKHGGATKVTIYAEPSPEHTAMVSVKDDGSGFDTDNITKGQGLDGSIVGRIAEVGGRVQIDGRPGRGAEIRMWV